MHRLYLTLILVLVAIVLLFVVQNADTVTVRFLAASITLPRALLMLLVYLLGMLTGGFVVSLLRSWLKGARQTKASHPEQRPGARGQAGL